MNKKEHEKILDVLENCVLCVDQIMEDVVNCYLTYKEIYKDILLVVYRVVN